MPNHERSPASHRPRIGALLVRALFGIACLFALGAAVQAEPADAQAPERPCELHADSSISQPLVLAGDRLEVTHTLLPRCPESAAPLHLVLVLDASGSMANEPNREMKKAARELVTQLDMRNNPSTKVGVVSFQSHASTLCQLTDSASRATSCINKVGAAGGTAISHGILAGIKVFNQGRRDVADPSALREVMLLLADGEDMAGCGPVQRAAGQASGQGIELLAISLGEGAHRPCLQSIASGPAGHRHAAAPDELLAAFESFGARLPYLAARSMEVRVELPANMAYVVDTAVPPPSGVGPQEIAWRIVGPLYGPVEVRYTLRPLEVGRWDVLASGGAELIGVGGPRGSAALPNARVQVLGPRPLP